MKVNTDPQKWSSRSGAAGAEFEAGAKNPKRSQSATAIASKDVWASQIQDAIGRGAYEKGLSKAGDAKWIKGITEKGRRNYQTGVGIAQDAYRAGFAPYASVLTGLELGPRGPKGQNYDRVQKVGEALRSAKLGR